VSGVQALIRVQPRDIDLLVCSRKIDFNGEGLDLLDAYSPSFLPCRFLLGSMPKMIDSEKTKARDCQRSQVIKP
jgi:hypothetical protein